MKAKELLLVLLLASLWACVGEDPDEDSLEHIEYNPQPYRYQIPRGMPPLPEDPDNPPTVDGVQLGRRLFYDPILSADSSISCSSCHNPLQAFTDGQAFSKGVLGQLGRRSSMTLLNTAYVVKGLFWDGRAKNLAEQALEPVENPLEMHEMWPNVIEKLKRHPDYPQRFRKAFGIPSKKAITKELAAKAISQWEKLLLTGGESLYAKAIRGETAFNVDQQTGYEMFINSDPLLPDAECFHCHAEPLFMANDFFNNGIDSVKSLADFKDKGRGDITAVLFDNGKFRAPTLFNIALTAPYMHDGRFKTLEEVIDHYDSGGHYALNKDGFIRPLHLTNRQKRQLVAFLKTLTDTSYLHNPDVLSPF